MYACFVCMRARCHNFVNGIFKFVYDRLNAMNVYEHFSFVFGHMNEKNRYVTLPPKVLLYYIVYSVSSSCHKVELQRNIYFPTIIWVIETAK